MRYIDITPLSFRNIDSFGDYNNVCTHTREIQLRGGETMVMTFNFSKSLICLSYADDGSQVRRFQKIVKRGRRDNVIYFRIYVCFFMLQT